MAAFSLCWVLSMNFALAQEGTWISKNIKFKELKCSNEKLHFELKTSPYFFIYNKSETYLLVDSLIDENLSCIDESFSFLLKLVSLDNGTKLQMLLIQDDKKTQVQILTGQQGGQTLDCVNSRFRCPEQVTPLSDFY